MEAIVNSRGGFAAKNELCLHKEFTHKVETLVFDEVGTNRDEFERGAMVQFR